MDKEQIRNNILNRIVHRIEVGKNTFNNSLDIYGLVQYLAENCPPHDKPNN